MEQRGHPGLRHLATEEDLLKYQKDFLSGSERPAARVSSFKKRQQHAKQEKEEPAAQPEPEQRKPVPVMGAIKERDVSAFAIKPPNATLAAGVTSFPAPFHRKSNPSSARLGLGSGGSSATNKTATPSEEASITAATLGRPTAAPASSGAQTPSDDWQQISSDSDRMLDDMSPEQKKEAEQYLLSVFGKDTVDFLAKRGQDSAEGVNKGASGTMRPNPVGSAKHTAKATEAPSNKVRFAAADKKEGEADKEDSEALRLREKGFWDGDLSETEMGDVPGRYGEPEQWRFAFDGRAMTKEESVAAPSHLGLHHHGDQPAAAGYTLAELMHLCRSQVASQRTIALQTLANIIRRVRSGEYSPRLRVDHLMSTPLAVCLRCSIDEDNDTVLFAGLNALCSAFALTDSVSDAYRTFQDCYRGYEAMPMAPMTRQPSLQLVSPWTLTADLPDSDDEDEDPASQGQPSSGQDDGSAFERINQKEKYKKEGTRAHISLCKKDLVMGMLDMNLLDRLVHILGNGKRNAGIIDCVLDLMIAVSVHSVHTARAVASHTDLLSVLNDDVLTFSTDSTTSGNPSRLPPIKAIQLVTTLCRSGSGVTLDLIHDGVVARALKFLYSAPPPAENPASQSSPLPFDGTLTHLRSLCREAILLWRVVFAFGFGQVAEVEDGSGLGHSFVQAMPTLLEYAGIGSAGMRLEPLALAQVASLLETVSHPQRSIEKLDAAKSKADKRPDNTLLPHLSPTLASMRPILGASVSSLEARFASSNESKDSLNEPLLCVGNILHFVASFVQHMGPESAFSAHASLGSSDALDEFRSTNGGLTPAHFLQQSDLLLKSDAKQSVAIKVACLIVLPLINGELVSKIGNLLAESDRHSSLYACAGNCLHGIVRLWSICVHIHRGLVDLLNVCSLQSDHTLLGTMAAVLVRVLPTLSPLSQPNKGVYQSQQQYDASTVYYGRPATFACFSLLVLLNTVRAHKRSEDALTVAFENFSRPFEKALEFVPGCRVLTSGLVAKPELNEVQGSVIRFNTKRQRYEVNLDGVEKIVTLKAENLSPCVASALNKVSQGTDGPLCAQWLFKLGFYLMSLFTPGDEDMAVATLSLLFSSEFLESLRTQANSISAADIAAMTNSLQRFFSERVGVSSVVVVSAYLRHHKGSLLHGGLILPVEGSLLPLPRSWPYQPVLAAIHNSVTSMADPAHLQSEVQAAASLGFSLPQVSDIRGLISSSLSWIRTLEGIPASPLHGVPAAGRLYHLLQVFRLPASVFNHEDVKGLVSHLFSNYISLTGQSSAIELRTLAHALNSLGIALAPLSSKLVTTYVSESFGNPVLGHMMVILLQPQFGEDTRKEIWREVILADLARLLPMPPAAKSPPADSLTAAQYVQSLLGLGNAAQEVAGDQRALTKQAADIVATSDLTLWFFPVDSDRPFLSLYANALRDGHLKMSISPFLFTVAVHHLSLGLFSSIDVQMGQERSVSDAAKLKMVLESPVLRSMPGNVMVHVEEYVLKIAMFSAQGKQQ